MGNKQKSKFNWKIVGISVFIGYIIALPLMFISSFLEKGICASGCINRVLFVLIYPSISNIHPDAGMALIFIVPFYGAIVGFLVGFSIASLIRKYKKKKSIFKRSGFYIILLMLIWLIIALIQPVTDYSESFEKPFFRQYLCNLQGYQYKELKSCSNIDIKYPEMPINQLPNETIYICELYDEQEVTREDLVNGTECSSINKRGETVYTTPFMHPVYGGYSFSKGVIYYENNPPGKKVCSLLGVIKYRSWCKP